MIFDRTQNDVNIALEIRENKVQNFQELTEQEIEILEKGMFTINTLNRIEEKQTELKNLINDMGYMNTPTENKTWGVQDIFDATEFSRIVNNINILRRAFFVYSNTPETPAVSYYFEDVNAYEKILHDLDVMINDVKSRYKRCGTFRCGELL